MLNATFLMELPIALQSAEAWALGGIAAGVFVAFVVLVELVLAVRASAVWLAKRLSGRRR